MPFNEILQAYIRRSKLFEFLFRTLFSYIRVNDSNFAGKPFSLSLLVKVKAQWSFLFRMVNSSLVRLLPLIEHNLIQKVFRHVQDVFASWLLITIRVLGLGLAGSVSPFFFKDRSFEKCCQRKFSRFKCIICRYSIPQNNHRSRSVLRHSHFTSGIRCHLHFKRNLLGSKIWNTPVW